MLSISSLGLVKLSVACSLDRPESFLSHTPAKRHQLQRAILQHPHSALSEFSLMASCLSCSGFEGRVWGVGVVTKPAMSLFLVCASAAIDTTAKVASFPLPVSRSTDHGLPHGSQWQQRPQTWPSAAVGPLTQTRSSEAAWTTDTNLAPRWKCRPLASLRWWWEGQGSMAHGHQLTWPRQDPWQQHEPNITSATSGNVGHLWFIRIYIIHSYIWIFIFCYFFSSVEP